MVKLDLKQEIPQRNLLILTLNAKENIGVEQSAQLDGNCLQEL